MERTRRAVPHRPKGHRHEIRCYLRDPDGHLIEVGQATGILDGEGSSVSAGA